MDGFWAILLIVIIISAIKMGEDHVSNKKYNNYVKWARKMGTPEEHIMKRDK